MVSEGDIPAPENFNKLLKNGVQVSPPILNVIEGKARAEGLHVCKHFNLKFLSHIQMLQTILFHMNSVSLLVCE